MSKTSGSLVWSSASQAPAFVTAFSPSQGRALCADLPVKRTVALMAPLQPTSRRRSVGSITTPNTASFNQGTSVRTRSRLLPSAGPSSPS